MSYYDVQQVCENGHQITDRFNTGPQFRRTFCAQCGAKTIHECPNCGQPIKGDYHADGVVVIGFQTPVPSHCENCGVAYPWVKSHSNPHFDVFASRIRPMAWYRRLSITEKFGFWGSFASIVGLVLVFIPPSSPPQSGPKAHATTSAAKSPAIGANQGNVTINYEGDTTAREKSYVVRNAKGGATLVVNKPSLDAAGDPRSHVCMLPAGTPITFSGESAKMGSIDMWRKVKITSGECLNKSGWVAIENINVE